VSFTGFPRETVRFLAALAKHNDKAWFDAHRGDYEGAFLAPAQAFVKALAPRLEKLDADVHAEPRVNGSIMRINRDVRFAKDKAPYKDHLDLWFWTGERKGWDSSGFFFRITPDRLLLGAGMHRFEPARLARYREAVLEPKRGQELARIAARLRKLGYEVGTETYKKPPRGVPVDHERTALLRHGGLHAGWEAQHPRELHESAIVELVAKHYAAVAPVHAWLRAM
jgi:uncharacterized protein (TIGR02453 family)